MSDQLAGFSELDTVPITDAQREGLKLVTIQNEMMARGRELGRIAWTSPLWAQFSLPHRDPGDVPFWSTQNRGIDLIVTPGTRRDDTGKRVSAGYPWGRVPRAMLTYMATQAVRTKDPLIQLGAGRNDFFRKIGISRGAPARQKQVSDLIEALAAADVKVEECVQGAAESWGYRWRRMSFVDGLQLWLNEDGAGDEAVPLWGSSVRLSDDFFESIIAAPMPILLEDLKLLGSSTFAHDIYIWLTYRLNGLTTRQTISYAQLREQFGSGFKREATFRATFNRHLARVLAVYEDANVSFSNEQSSITLFPSRPRVPHKRQLAS